MAARKKKRTSIRTAAGTAQERFLERLRALRGDAPPAAPRRRGSASSSSVSAEQRASKEAIGRQVVVRIL